MNKLLTQLCVCGALSVAGSAGETRYWTSSEQADFEKANLKKISFRSDGRLMLAPKFQEIFDSSSAYLWALAHDSKGNLFAGGGPGAKVFRISPSGEKKAIAELEGLEVHAIAVDKRDTVFAATSPDGKVYKLAPTGKAEVFYDPKAKYIWAMVFSSAGDMFIATGDEGVIHKVSATGQGSVFFRTEETHARSLAVDAQGNLIVGTEPGGLVLRVNPSGQGFVLYQMAKREVTAVAVAKDGSVYAAGVGNKQPAASLPTPIPPSPSPAPVAPAPAQQRPPVAPPPTLVSMTPSVSGGTDVYQILPEGYPRKVWSHAQDLVYTIGFDSQDRVLLGTGNRGYIYRLAPDNLFWTLLNATSTQVTCLAAVPGGAVFAATANSGKVYEISSQSESEGTIESETFDAGLFSYWGRLAFTGDTNGGRVSITTRSGNWDRPQKNWSPWSAPLDSKGGRIASPSARFLQWKATLSASASGQSPELEKIEAAYLTKNVAPRIEQIEITPPNYRFPPQLLTLTPQQNITLQPLGRKPTAPSLSISSDSGSVTMQFSKGFLGARWAATDENSDTMLHSVHIRGAQETEWKLLKDKVKEKNISWDSTAFPDGEYRLRVTTSDAPSNTREIALSSQMESSPFTIDNTPPKITGLAAARSGDQITVRWKSADLLSVIQQAEYSLDGGEWTVVLPTTRLSDSKEHDYELILAAVPPGEHTIAVRVQDEFENQVTEKAVVQ